MQEIVYSALSNKNNKNSVINCRYQECFNRSKYFLNFGKYLIFDQQQHLELFINSLLYIPFQEYPEFFIL